MSGWIKNNVKKVTAIGGISLIGIGGLIKIISDEAQEWHSIVDEPEELIHIHVDEVGRKIVEEKRDSLLKELNRIQKEIEKIDGAR